MMDLQTIPDHSPEFELQTLLEVGCHFGHQAAKWQPRMKPYIYMEKDGVHIFDLAQTAAQLKAAYNVAYELGKSGKTLVIVGTKKQARDCILDISQTNKVPYIVSRWLGGLLTNWDQVQKSLKRMIQIEEGLKTDKFKNYTKYERLQLEKEMSRLKRFFEGIRDLKNKPDALFIIDLNKEKNAVKEAAATGVFTIGVVDSNANPDLVDIAIPSNDDGKAAVQYVISQVVAGYMAGKNA